MEHSIAYTLGMLVGILAAIGLAVLIWAVYRRRFGKAEYDERQKLAQGQAYKAAFYTLIIYGTVYGLFDMLTGLRWCELYTGLFIGILLSVLVFAIICIRQDAYISFRRKPAASYALLLGLAAVNITIGVLHLNEPGYFIDGGLLTAQVINPLVGVMLVLVTAAMAVRDARRRRNERPEA